MLVDNEKLSALITLIYDAALDDALWSEVTRELTQQFNAINSFMFTPRLMAEGGHSFALAPPVNVGKEFIEDYETYYWQHDAWMSHGLDMGVVQSGNIVHGDQLIERRTFLQTEIYNDFVKPHRLDWGVLLCGIIFDRPTPEHAQPILISFFKPPDAAAFTQADERLLQKLLPHFQRSLRIRWKLQEKKQARQLREQALEQLAIGMVLLDSTGQLLFANRKAEELLRQSRNPCLLNGFFCCIDSYQNNAIKQALHQARQGIGSTLRLDNPPPTGTRVITISPVSTTKTEQLRLPAPIVVMITEPDKPTCGDLSAFAKLYRLTAAETQVLQHLLQQQNPQEIAATLCVSIKTVRTQLSALFSKTQTKNQRELIQFCLSHPMMETSEHDYR